MAATQRPPNEQLLRGYLSIGATRWRHKQDSVLGYDSSIVRAPVTLRLLAQAFDDGLRCGIVTNEDEWRMDAI